MASSVEMLDMSQGAWQPFPVSLGRATEEFQAAVLDYELGMFLRTKCTVNDRFLDECTRSTTTTTPGGWQACVVFVLDESGSIVTRNFDQVRFSKKHARKQ